MKTVKTNYNTLKELGITDIVTYDIMSNFCNTICNLGLAPMGYSALLFRDANCNTHLAGACFKFYVEEDRAFFGEPYILVTGNK